MAATLRRVLPNAARTWLRAVSTRVAVRNYSTPKTITVKLEPFQTHKCEGPKLTSEATTEECLKFFYDMSVMRRMEIAADKLYKQKLIRGFLHLYNGQEAVAVGMESAITKKDHVITAYRDHALVVARGETPRAVLAELLGKYTGTSKGKGGSMHMYKKDANFYGGNGIVGAQCPIGAGVAFGLKYLKRPEVSFTFYGDGAANQGQLYEAFNMAALWKLPVVFVCENNHYAMGTAVKRAAADTDFYKRGDYVPGVKADGMNVFAAKEAFAYARQWCLQGNGPLVLEMDTYRYVGHSMSDPGTTYRNRNEIDKVRAERDPIVKMRSFIVANGMATEDELEALDQKAIDVIDDAVKFALESPPPGPEELWKDVYVEDTFIRGVELPESHHPGK